MTIDEIRKRRRVRYAAILQARVEGKTHQEIADELGISVKRVLYLKSEAIRLVQWRAAWQKYHWQHNPLGLD